MMLTPGNSHSMANDKSFDVKKDRICGKAKRCRRINHTGNVGNCHLSTSRMKFPAAKTAKTAETAVFEEIEPANTE